MPQWAGLFLGHLSNREDSDLQSFSSRSSLAQGQMPHSSMFQLWQYFPFRQELTATQEVLSIAGLQKEQQGQGQEANGASPTGAS